MSPNRGPYHVLLVEDSPTDAELTLEALAAGPARYEVNVARDGREALDALRRPFGAGDGHPPDLILLDLKLPVVSGWEVLGTVKADPRLKTIPVVVLSSSADPADVRRAYDGYANCYVTKPLDVDQFMGRVRAVADFWFTVADLPPS